MEELKMLAEYIDELKLSVIKNENETDEKMKTMNDSEIRLLKDIIDDLEELKRIYING